MSLVTKIIVSAALLLGVSASITTEVVCQKGKSATLYSVNDYQTTPCLTIPLTNAQNRWGGGKSKCNAGTFEEYWNISNVGMTWLCYGKTTSCTPILATEYNSFAKSHGYDKCWSVTFGSPTWA
ncbi:hypothetical protein EDD21DRAFT_393701 [Dissophora ornata]|nr:hypothetical protein BGZ58_004911 [Dissophora ornata]KAI8594370.1 hypothetical protein EDD21DRAFT_393701 [Dissophora ornata]